MADVERDCSSNSEKPAEGGSAAAKPSVLIIGGLGYIGRFFALHIYQNELASDIRLVDKQLPELAWLSEEFGEACSRDKFMQADASRDQSLSRIFAHPTPGRQYTYIFNCAGETRLAQDDSIYRFRSHAVSVALASECARRTPRPILIELSTGQVYKPSRKTPCTESAVTKPWLRVAKWKLKAEEDLSKVVGLDVMVLRLANVYGPYVTAGFGTALCMARTYQSLGKEMRWLWDKELRTNTVHVDDVVRAMWRAAEWYGEQREKRKRQGLGEAPLRPVPAFNIVDHGDTSQKTLSTLLSSHFSIPCTFAGPLLSTFARLNLDRVVDDVNDELLDPWASLLSAAGLNPGPPISPFMEKEAILDRDLCMDGSDFERVVGFRYDRERLGEMEVVEMVESYRRMGWWP